MRYGPSIEQNKFWKENKTMAPYGYIPPRELELIRAVKPWTIGFEEIGNRNRPILKPGAPEEIVKMRDELWELVLASDDTEETIEDFSQ